MTTTVRKIILGVLIAALIIVAVPLASAYAAGMKDTSTPPAPSTADPTVAKARIELAFARQQVRIARIGAEVANFDLIARDTQILIDKAKAKGKDVTALQAAFDAFKAAFEKGKPIYEQADALVRSHAGFDGNGNATDIAKAKDTVKSQAATLKQYHDTVGDSFKAFREAIKAFRQANPGPNQTPIQP